MSFLKSNSKAYGGGATDTLAFPTSNGLGNLLIAVASLNSTTAPVITDSQTNTWNTLFAPIGNTTFVSAFYAFNSKAGANTVTFTIGVGVAGTIAILEFDQVISVADPKDQQTSSSFSGATTATTGTVTTTQVSELVLQIIGQFETNTPTQTDASTTRVSVTGSNGLRVTEKLVTTTAGYSASFTYGAGSSGGIGIATFKSLGTKLYLNPRRPAVFKPGIAR